MLPDVGSRMIESGLQAMGFLEVRDQRPGDPVLDRARRVHHLELGEDPDVRVRRHPGDLDERRVADRVEDAVVAAAVRAQRLVGVLVLVAVARDHVCVPRGLAQRDHRLEPPVDPPVEPPAMAGSRRTSSAAATDADSPPR